MKKICLLLFCFLSLKAECNIDYKVLYTIASVEGHPKRNVGYPFLISFNNKENLQWFLQNYNHNNYIKLDNRSIDCVNREICVQILDFLIKNKIKNLDLGAFSLNYKFVRFDNNENFFSLSSSYKMACKILTLLTKKHGWSMETIAKYHSSTKHHNQRYQKILEKAYITLNEAL